MEGGREGLSRLVMTRRQKKAPRTSQNVFSVAAGPGALPLPWPPCAVSPSAWALPFGRPTETRAPLSDVASRPLCHRL